MSFLEEYQVYQDKVEEYLQGFIQRQKQLPPMGKLQEAMEYSLLGSGKRLRPVLVLASCEMLGGKVEEALPFACATELIHCYSLIHDDLPAMDDDDLRRGKPSCHKQFDEATAILAGDALLTSAFVEMAMAQVRPDKMRAATHCLATLSGVQGMVGGQALELSEDTLTLPKLQQIQSMKTGALLVASCNLGGIIAEANQEERSKLTVYAGALGRAFQIRDDILDATGEEAKLGKPIGSDESKGKNTFYTVLGHQRAQELVLKLSEEGVEALSGLENTGFLTELMNWLAIRKN